MTDVAWALAVVALGCGAWDVARRALALRRELVREARAEEWRAEHARLEARIGEAEKAIAGLRHENRQAAVASLGRRA